MKAVVSDRDRCMMLLVQIAVKKQQYPSNLQGVGLYTAENVTRNIEVWNMKAIVSDRKDAALVSEKCIMSPVPIAVKKHKFLLNPLKVNLYIAENVSRNIGHLKFT